MSIGHSPRRYLAVLRSRSAIRAIVIGLLAAAVVTTGWLSLAPSDAGLSAFKTVFAASLKPHIQNSSDRRATELGVRFTSNRDVTVRGIRFFKGSKNAGPHIGSLWSASGSKLATVAFVSETKEGWQTATFDQPIVVRAGQSYVASYLAPRGRYSATVKGFTHAVSDGTVTYPVGAGVYSHSPGTFPTRSYRNSNYFVDLVYSPSVAADTQTAPSSGTGPSPEPPTTTGPPTTGPDNPSTQPGTVPPGTLPRSGANLALSLARVPWEGGPSYWNKFPVAAAAGWTNPDFFPIAIWFNQIDTDAQVTWDKAHGVNTYVELWDGTPYSILERNGVYYAGGKLNSTFNTTTSKNWVGDFLADEVDGRYNLNDQGQQLLQSLKSADAGDGRFQYANFTQMVVSGYFKPVQQVQYVNNYTDVVSLDQYFYTAPYCANNPYYDALITSIPARSCRSSASYGATAAALRIQDAADGKLQPIWQFVEDLNGTSAGDYSSYITPGQLKGAVMNSIINEARGIIYFNQSFSGPCQSGAVLRDAQNDPNFCGATQVAAMGDVDATIKSLAPVLNTQSYAYTFGPNLDTMLKTYGSSAYIFAMIDGKAAAGTRSFRLPPQLVGSKIEVLNENRMITPSTNGTFTDSFAAEYSYHIYKVTPQG